MFVYCRWEHRIKRRYYEVRIDRDLFGWGITRVWGGIGSPRGRLLHTPCENFEIASREMKKIARKRKQRGYVEVAFKSGL